MRVCVTPTNHDREEWLRNHSQGDPGSINSGSPAVISLDRFSAKEIHIVDALVHEITELHSATSISEKSHDIIWDITEYGEEIPYYASWLRTLEPATEKELAWAADRIAGPS
jgi:hypothetical protein